MHETYAIGVIEHGAERFYALGAHHLAPPDSLILLNPGTIHDGQAGHPDGWTYRMIYLEVSWMRTLLGEALGGFRGEPFFSGPVVEDLQLAQTLLSLHRTARSSSTFEWQDKLTCLLTHLFDRHAGHPPPRVLPRAPDVARAAQALLDAHFHEELSLLHLAHQFNLSPQHFIGVFRREVGLPPHAYQTHRRVQHARFLLRAGHPIAEVALEVGFVDQSHLTRHFKRLLGTTPGRYVRGR